MAAQYAHLLRPPPQGGRTALLLSGRGLSSHAPGFPSNYEFIVIPVPKEARRWTPMRRGVPYYEGSQVTTHPQVTGLGRVTGTA